MSEFKNLSDEDVLRIERGIVYSFPARDGTGLIVCVGTYGDLTNQVRVKGGATMGEFLPMATDRLTYWFCHRIDGILSGEEITGSTGWTIVDGKPVAPGYVIPLPGTDGYLVDEVEQGFQDFLRENGCLSVSGAEQEQLRAAFQHGATGLSLAPHVPLPDPDIQGNIYGLPARLFTEKKGMGSAFHDHVEYLAAQAAVTGEQHLLNGRIAARAKQLGLI